MRIRLAQLVVERTVERNFAKIQEVLSTVQAGDWIVFPEAMLSGYFPEEPDYAARLNPELMDRSIAAIHELVRDRGCHCLLGSALRSPVGWQNAGLLLHSHGRAGVYAKIQLSALDLRHFQPGSTLPVFDVDGVRVGMQLCRDLLFPQQWLVLRQAGAQMICHLNNAIKPHDAIWEHVLITRALEQAMFVCSVNNAAAPQQLTSYLIAPDGRVVLKARPQQEEVLTATIDLSTVVANLADRQDF